MAQNKDFAVNFVDALFKTLAMAIGELEGWDKVPELDNENWTEWTSGQKWTLYLGRMCLMAFVFLFVVVLLNLLNAIAIGDVQVCNNKHINQCNKSFFKPTLFHLRNFERMQQ